MCLECDEKALTRRGFLAATGLGAVAALAGSAPARKRSSIVFGEVKFRRGADSVDAFLARPSDSGKRRAVLILHGNAGVPEDARRAAREMAESGFLGFAVSSTSREPDASKITREFLMSDRYIDRYVEDARAGIEYLSRQVYFNSAGIGILGFCGGGYTAARFAERDDRAKAFVAFYAAPIFHPPRISETDPRPNMIDFIDRLKIPMQFHFGTADDLIPNEDVTRLREKLRQAGAKFEIYNYENAAHGFYNFNGPTFNAPYAGSAIARGKKFLRKHL
jgi:carboxymethylenebutenolidase